MSESFTGMLREEAWRFLAEDMKLDLPALVRVLTWIDGNPGKWYPGGTFRIRRDGKSYSMEKK